MTEKILQDIKILDFGAFIAGPAASQYLGFLGAQIIKIEHPRHPDGGRLFSTSPTQETPNPRLSASQIFDLSNLGKRDLALDFSKQEGKDILWALIDKADIICENMSVGAMGRLGFGYDEVQERKPDIIYLSSSACGEFGPEKDFVGYAATFAAKAGLGAVTGYPGSPPSTFVGSLDIRSANAAAVAMIAALFHRKRTGQGQYIEIASQEAIASQLGEYYLDYSVNRHDQGPMANTRPGFAPQGAYPTKGKDQWVAISIETDVQWQDLCRAMGKTELIENPALATYEGRSIRIEELDCIIRGWTKDKDKLEVFRELQALNVPCGPVYSSKGVYEDIHRRMCNSFALVPHRDLGRECIARPAWRFEKTAVDVDTCSPYHGEHTVQILKEELDMSDKDIQALVDKRVVRRLLDTEFE